jgi:superfamily II RNA helicase
MEYRGLRLDRFQEEAIAHVKEGRSVLVSAPTGTGKTIIADYIVDQALGRHEEVIYTAPIKALSNQKYRDYTRLYGTDRVGLVTGDLVINRDAQLRIMTTEILRNMLLQGESLPHLSYVIVDEIHFLDDVERGTVWEEMLIYLPQRVKILGLSATLSNLKEFAAWLAHVRGEDVPVVTEHQRAVPLKIFLANRDAGIVDKDRFEFLHGRFAEMQKQAEEAMAKEQARHGGRGRHAGHGPHGHHGPPHSHHGHRDAHGGRGRGRDRNGPAPLARETRHWELVHMLGARFQPLLYFVFSRKMTEQFARELARKVPDGAFVTPSERQQILEAVQKFDAEFLKVMTGEQEAMYLRGIAFHHAGLHVGLKAFVEELYERKLIKVLYCTSTFALGINMPARTVCFQALRKFDGKGIVPLTVRQFMQKAGRAGRRGLDEVGYVVILEEFANYGRDRDSIAAYLLGQHEGVRSAFNLSFNSVVNLLDRHERNCDAIRDVIDKSFLNFHYEQIAKRERAQLDDIARGLAKDGWDPEAEDSGPPPRHLEGRAKRYRKAKKANAETGDRVWQDFMGKVGILQDIGYIDSELGFNAGAKVLKHVQIEEVLTTELALSGLLDQAEPALLFGAVCALANDFGRTTTVRERPRGEALALARSMRNIRFSDVVRRAEESAGTPPTFCPEMIPFGIAWYAGRPLNELMLMVESATDISGDLVSAFRRAKDLCQQLKRVYDGDEYMTAKLVDVMKTISRDEVEVVD